MNLSFGEIVSLQDRGHLIYEIWKSPIYVNTKYGKGGGDYYTDPVLQVQSFSEDNNRLPFNVTKRFAPIKKLKIASHIHRWSYGAGYSESSDIETLLMIFKQAGYPVVRIEEKKDSFGRTYLLYFVANTQEHNECHYIGEK